MFRSSVAHPRTNDSLFAVEKQMVNDNTHSIHVWYILPTFSIQIHQIQMLVNIPFMDGYVLFMAC